MYVDTPLEAIPLFQRGGTIIPMWERVRRASTLMRQDPITLYIASDFKVDMCFSFMLEARRFAHSVRRCFYGILPYMTEHSSSLRG